MGKTRVGVILREGMSGGKSSNTSADLQNLTLKYQGFVKKLRALREALQQQHLSLQQLERTRTNVAKNFASFSKSTPLWESTGQLPGGDRPADSVCSYASVHDQLSAKTKSYATKYKQFVIDYVVEWEKTVTTRIDAGLKKAEEHRRELDHYQKKVEALRLTTNKALAQGKSVKPDQQEKLKRNEEKLISAKQTYNKVTSALCILMEEVSERSWRDLHPLLIKVVQFDMTLAGDESKILGTFSSIVDTLKSVGSTNGISPQHRLKDLGSLNPELLSTRPGGASGFAAIESGGGASSSGSVGGSVSPTGSLASGGGAAFDPMALPPGTVGAQGMGGFPVAVAAASAGAPSGGASASGPPSRQSSFSSYNSSPPNVASTNSFEPPSTLGMLTISSSAAPAPTLEDVYSSGYNPSSTSATTSGAGYRSAPVSGTLPPLPPSTTPMSASPRASSFSDYDQMGAMAGPPAAPPPPPPGGAPSPLGGGYGATPSPTYGAPSPYGQPPPPPPGAYGGAPPPAAYSSPYGAPPPPPQPPHHYGQAPPPPTSQAPNMTNPFGY